MPSLAINLRITLWSCLIFFVCTASVLTGALRALTGGRDALARVIQVVVFGVIVLTSMYVPALTNALLLEKRP
jgi:hypothetical protein